MSSIVGFILLGVSIRFSLLLICLRICITFITKNTKVIIKTMLKITKTIVAALY